MAINCMSGLNPGACPDRPECGCVEEINVADLIRAARAEGYAAALEDAETTIIGDLKGMHFSNGASSLKLIITDSYNRILTAIRALKGNRNG